jgi:alpha-glutamyl/putrescinyl thymine pyrophosphorylase-like protein
MLAGMHKGLADEIAASFAKYEKENGGLPGLKKSAWRETLIKQIISSLRRIAYVHAIRDREVSASRLDPHQAAFDPLKGASFLMRRGELDEAVWLTFVATHFGKHKDDGWKLAANVFGSFGARPIWTAKAYGRAPDGFLEMLTSHRDALSDMRRSGRYSNHRQYQSKAPEFIARTFRSFYDWQFSEGGFPQLIRGVHKARGQNPTEAFDVLYKSLGVASGFGRLGKFDFLTMLSKLHIAPIEAGSTYLVGATGPLAGARLLFFKDRDHAVSARALQARVDALDDYLKVGKQVIEDSLCNWQKRPDRYEYFRG